MSESGSIRDSVIDFTGQEEEMDLQESTANIQRPASTAMEPLQRKNTADQLIEGQLDSFTNQQADAIKSAFRKADGGSGMVGQDDVEGLIADLFNDTLTDEMIDIIIEMTDGLESVNLAGFFTIVSTLMARTTFWGKLSTQTSGHVGIDSINNQIHKKLLKKGFEFNIMVVGESGLGKSTFVDTLFHSKVSRATACGTEFTIPSPEKTVEVHAITHVVEENNVRLKLSIVDTPGFGDQINNDNCWRPLIDHIDQQFEDYLQAEMAIDRPRHIPDTRIHCCIYFIAPSGHGLKPLDVTVMKKLHNHVNLIPVMAKGDILTLAERQAFKKRIRAQMVAHGIKCYPQPSAHDNDDEAMVSEHIRGKIPYAIVGSNTTRSVNGVGVRGRLTKFGFVEVENPDHCEFSALRDVLIKSNMQDLKDVTHFDHYERYRQERLQDGEAAEEEDLSAPAQSQMASKPQLVSGGESIASGHTAV